MEYCQRTGIVASNPLKGVPASIAAEPATGTSVVALYGKVLVVR
jgi:hypothetical protein